MRVGTGAPAGWCQENVTGVVAPGATTERTPVRSSIERVTGSSRL